MADQTAHGSDSFSEPDISDDDMGLDPGFTPEQIQRIQDEAILADTAAEGPSQRKKAKKGKGNKRNRDKLKAEVWNHFEKGDMREDRSYDAKCKYCGHIYLMGNSRGTASMRHHIFNGGCKKMPKKHKRDVLQRLLVAGPAAGDAQVAAWVFDQDICRTAFAQMVIVHEYPFNFVSHHYLKVFLRLLQPEFKLVTRNTVKQDCMNIYEKEGLSLYAFLEKLDCNVSLTSDLWTSNSENRGFMSLTCHYIDDGWKLMKRIIFFSALPSPHTRHHIAQAIYEKLVLWNLDKKVMSLVLDNASSNDACIRELLKTPMKDTLSADGNLFHQRCGCHILNLIVQDGLAVLSKEIHNIREMMKYIRHSQRRMEKFRLACSQAHVTDKKTPVWDVDTRWNSTYKMLNLALELKPAIERFSTMEKQRYHNLPSQTDWDNVGALVEPLRVFYDATVKLSGTKYPTLNLFYPEFSEVCLTIKKMSTSPLPFIVEMSKVMYDKWDKYWSCGNALLALACVLDPTCKLLVVEYYYNIIEPDDCERFMASLKTCLDAMFKEYLENHSKSAERQASMTSKRSRNPSGEVAGSSINEIRAGLKDFIRGKQSTEPVKSELEEYLSEGVDEANGGDEFDILSWWRLKAPKYPILSRLARDILAVPISTVASESAFSTGGRVLSPARNSLSDQSIEALICAQDWLKATVTEAGGEIGAPL